MAEKKKRLKKVQDHRKTYALDTNVLIFDPHAMLKLGDNHVVIPLPVLEELDSFKKGQDSRAQAAREVNRRIDELRVLAQEQGTYLFDGVVLEHGGTIRVLTNIPSEYRLHPGLDSEKNR